MALYTILCLLVAYVVSLPAVKGDSTPWFCHDLDCPKFDVVKKTDDYELRRYPAAAWVSTTVDSYIYEIAVTTGFERLFAYISGANDANVTINMTAPVRVKIEPGAGPFCKSNFTVSFFVPFIYQDGGAPVPTNPDVFLDSTPKTEVYVGEFGGFATTFTINGQAKKLTDALDENDKDYAEEFFYFAGYDAPFRLTNRHNEVWIVKKNGKSSPFA